MSGLLIKTIVDAGTYTCTLGELTYTFSSDLSELNNSTDTSYVNFYDSVPYQEISFLDTAAPDVVGFSYQLLSPIETIDMIDLNFTQDPVNPPPSEARVDSTPPLGSPPSIPYTLTTIIEPAGSAGSQTLTSLTQKIYKSPAPLPLAGAGLAFGFSRKLRCRIGRASHRAISA
ncbi:MAG: hypothetical protein VKO39_01665 [Cyanobacteriota bacterium]|nr:hypothetical protein [Cyanobacteriota bacterium]